MNYQSTRWKRRTSMERARLLAEYEQSELTQREFAERNGISMSCLSQWLRKSRAVGNGQAKHPAFLELPVPLPPRESARPMFRIELPSGQSVELDTGFMVEELRQMYPSGEPRLAPLTCAPKLARCQGFRAAFQAVGVNSATRFIGHVPSLGSTSPRYSRNLMSNRRQVSTIEITAAIFGPAVLSPKCNQFLRPNAMGRMPPSHDEQ